MSPQSPTNFALHTLRNPCANREYGPFSQVSKPPAHVLRKPRPPRLRKLCALAFHVDDPPSPDVLSLVKPTDFTLWLILPTLFIAGSLQAQPLGNFEQAADIGEPARQGRSEFDAASGTYTLTGGGANMWGSKDAFHFLWRRESGEGVLQAAIDWVGAGGDPHRKACLMVRESLEPDAPYVDVAVHGDGLTSLQYRAQRGGPTREIQVGKVAPAFVALARQGDTFFVRTGTHPDELRVAGAYVRVKLADPIYVGLGVCAHDDQVVETARFRHVRLSRTPEAPATELKLHSSLEIVPIASGDRRVVHHTMGHFEAPNWSPDGAFFLFNSSGLIYRLSADGGTPAVVDTGFAKRCNNDHGISPDGKMLVISDQSQTGKSLIYTLPIQGGAPRLVTRLGPSYWHGWSPDGGTLAYCAERNGEYDIYTIPVRGGEETRLTTAQGLDDGPDYTPDGSYLYFNSERTGRMKIWRMKPDGSGQEQVTHDDLNDWFPHPSPDGKWIVFLSYEPEVKGHPANHPVRLRLMSISGGPIREIAQLFGGQGTINVPSWSPDSKQLAFVSYELLRP